MDNLVYKEESYKIMGACFEVYKEKGCGFLESVYHECLGMEFEIEGIPFLRNKAMPLRCKGRALKQAFVADFICYESIIVEIKAVSRLIDEHRAQTLNYLASTGYRLGLLVNFGHFPKLEWERLAGRLQPEIEPAAGSFSL